MDENRKRTIRKERPCCYGRLDRVFPMGKNGFRESPDSCSPCMYKTGCLRQAMAGPEGLKVRVEMVDRSHRDGWRGAFRRWSTRKTLARQIKEVQKQGEDK
ncbi:MAG: hypothetical protein DSY89_08815 [Deltaproteobacteria bacterium]|nr:MAG: hypothetical protein DSY89_08815 [Deltaproteobacteria bacterium]